MPKAWKNCKASEDEIKAFIKALTDMATPQSFAYHIGKDLIVNGIQIFKEINASIGDFKSQNYKAFGTDVGTAVRLLILGTEKYKYGTWNKSLGRDIDWAKYLQIFEGIGEGLGIKLIEECISDSETFSSLMVDGIHNLRLKTPMGEARGLYDIAYALTKPLPAAIQACKGTVDEVKQSLRTQLTIIAPNLFSKLMYKL